MSDAEFEVNTAREPFAIEELATIGRRIEALEKPAAQARKRAGNSSGGKAKGKGKSKPKAKEVAGKLPATSGDTRDKVAAALGVSGKTYEKAKEVVEAAEQEPDVHGDLPQMAPEQPFLRPRQAVS